MRRPNFLFVLVTVILGVCPAGRLYAQAVYGNTTIRGMEAFRYNAPRGSNSMSFFRKYSTGSNLFSQQLTRSQRDPLALNTQIGMGMPSAPSLGIPSLGVPAGTSSRRISNRVSTYKSGFSSSFLSNRGTYRPADVATGGAALTYGTGFTAGMGFSPGRGLPAVAIHPAGRGFTPRMGLTAGSGFMSGMGRRFSNQRLYSTSRFPGASVLQSKPDSLLNLRSPFGNRSLTQRSSRLSRNSPTIAQKPFLTTRKTLTDQNISQQRISRSFFGAAQPQSFGRTNIFSTWRY